MKGVVFDEKQHRYTMLEESSVERFEREQALPLANRSRFGSTIRKGLQTVRSTIEKEPGIRLAVLEFGGNDCDFDWEAVAAEPLRRHEPKTPLPEFIACYKEMLDFLKEKGVMPVMMNLPPVDGERYLAFLAARGLSREAILKNIKSSDQISRFQELYSLTVERIAHETGTHLVDCRSRFLDRSDIKETLCLDGIHPSDKGHRLIYQSFVDFLKQLPRDLKLRLGNLSEGALLMLKLRPGLRAERARNGAGQ